MDLTGSIFDTIHLHHFREIEWCQSWHFRWRWLCQLDISIALAFLGGSGSYWEATSCDDSTLMFFTVWYLSVIKRKTIVQVVQNMVLWLPINSCDEVPVLQSLSSHLCQKSQQALAWSGVIQTGPTWQIEAAVNPKSVAIQKGKSGRSWYHIFASWLVQLSVESCGSSSSNQKIADLEVTFLQADFCNFWFGNWTCATFGWKW